MDDHDFVPFVDSDFMLWASNAVAALFRPPNVSEGNKDARLVDWILASMASAGLTTTPGHIAIACTPHIDPLFDATEGFLNKRREMRGDPQATVERRFMFHSPRNGISDVVHMVANNYDISKSAMGNFGTGIYLTPSARKALSYSIVSHGYVNMDQTMKEMATAKTKRRNDTRGPESDVLTEELSAAETASPYMDTVVGLVEDKFISARWLRNLNGHHTKIILVFETLSGRPFKTPMNQTMRWITAPPPGYNYVEGTVFDNAQPECVFYSADHVRPVAMVMYRETPGVPYCLSPSVTTRFGVSQFVCKHNLYVTNGAIPLARRVLPHSIDADVDKLLLHEIDECYTFKSPFKFKQQKALVDVAQIHPMLTNYVFSHAPLTDTATASPLAPLSVRPVPLLGELLAMSAVQGDSRVVMSLSTFHALSVGGHVGSHWGGTRRSRLCIAASEVALDAMAKLPLHVFVAFAKLPSSMLIDQLASLANPRNTMLHIVDKLFGRLAIHLSDYDYHTVVMGLHCAQGRALYVAQGIASCITCLPYEVDSDGKALLDLHVAECARIAAENPLACVKTLGSATAVLVNMVLMAAVRKTHVHMFRASIHSRVDVLRRYGVDEPTLKKIGSFYARPDETKPFEYKRLASPTGWKLMYVLNAETMLLHGGYIPIGTPSQVAARPVIDMSDPDSGAETVLHAESLCAVMLACIGDRLVECDVERSGPYMRQLVMIEPLRKTILETAYRVDVVHELAGITDVQTSMYAGEADMLSEITARTHRDHDVTQPQTPLAICMDILNAEPMASLPWYDRTYPKHSCVAVCVTNGAQFTSRIIEFYGTPTELLTSVTVPEPAIAIHAIRALADRAPRSRTSDFVVPESVLLEFTNQLQSMSGKDAIECVYHWNEQVAAHAIRTECKLTPVELLQYATTQTRMDSCMYADDAERQAVTQYRSYLDDVARYRYTMTAILAMEFLGVGISDVLHLVKDGYISLKSYSSRVLKMQEVMSAKRRKMEVGSIDGACANVTANDTNDINDTTDNGESMERTDCASLQPFTRDAISASSPERNEAYVDGPTRKRTISDVLDDSSADASARSVDLITDSNIIRNYMPVSSSDGSSPPSKAAGAKRGRVRRVRPAHTAGELIATNYGYIADARDSASIAAAIVGATTKQAWVNVDESEMASIGCDADCTVCLNPLFPSPMEIDGAEGCNTNAAAIAVDVSKTVVRMRRCPKCVFHESCINYWVAQCNGTVKCPRCQAFYSRGAGPQPHGIMVVERSTNPHFRLEGHWDDPFFLLSFNFSHLSDVNQTLRHAFIPDTPDGRGRRAVALLIKAFDERELFRIGFSVSRNMDNCVIMNGIHLKTAPNGGDANYGWPSPSYFDRLEDELRLKGITLDD